MRGGREEKEREERRRGGGGGGNGRREETGERKENEKKKRRDNRREREDKQSQPLTPPPPSGRQNNSPPCFPLHYCCLLSKCQQSKQVTIILPVTLYALMGPGDTIQVRSLLLIFLFLSKNSHLKLEIPYIAHK